MPNSFTFWENMKDTIDVIGDNPVLKCKMYEALVDYGLYGQEPDQNDCSEEGLQIKILIQSLKPSLEKSSNWSKNHLEASANGGSKQKYSDESLIEAIKMASIECKGVPTKNKIVECYRQMYGDAPTTKTISRRFDNTKIGNIARNALKEETDIKTFLDF